MSRPVELGALVGSVVVGLWMLAAPDVLGLEGGARLSHLIVGPLAASLAVIGMAPATRLAVRVNVVLGLWSVLAVLLFDHGGWWLEGIVAGATLTMLALVPRSQAERFGGGWGSLLARDHQTMARRPPASEAARR